jgi:hypothetical protein
VIGTSAMANQRVVTEMTIRMAMYVATLPANWIMEVDSTESMISTSREKRLRMRPAGLVSKKDLGSRRMWSSSWLCSDSVALTQPKRKRVERRKVTPA